LAPELIETARDLAAQEGLRVDFAVGDAERLANPDASFDVVSSAHGVVHAYDHRAVASELARVCRPGGRLGVTYWLPNPELQALMERVGYARPPGADLTGDGFAATMRSRCWGMPSTWSSTRPCARGPVTQGRRCGGC